VRNASQPFIPENSLPFNYITNHKNIIGTSYSILKRFFSFINIVIKNFTTSPGEKNKMENNYRPGPKEKKIIILQEVPYKIFKAYLESQKRKTSGESKNDN